jgi:heme oxygenase
VRERAVWRQRTLPRRMHRIKSLWAAVHGMHDRVRSMSRLLDRLNEETRELQAEHDAEIHQLLGPTGVEHYRRFLARTYGFVRPLERSLVRTQNLGRYLDIRRLRKSELLRQDLDALGMKPEELTALSQCTGVPWFEDVHEALGWAYLVERSTLVYPNLFRHLATIMPGEVAFSSSYLKCYFGAVGEMWRSFGDGLDAAVADPLDADTITEAAKASFRACKRWRSQLDRRQAITLEEIERIEA